MLGANIFNFCFVYRHIKNRIWKRSYKMLGKPSLSRREYFRNFWKFYPQISTTKFKSTTIETFLSDRSYYVIWHVGYLKFWRRRFSRYVAQHSTVTSSITPFLTWYFQDWPTEKLFSLPQRKQIWINTHFDMPHWKVFVLTYQAL